MTRTANGLFVTGTDTGVGKTEVACALIRAASRHGLAAVGMKPVAAGARRAEGVAINADVRALQQASSIRVARAALNPYVLAPPIAPHLAARDAGIALDLDVMVRAYRMLAARAQVVIVEGAGGFRVPLDARRDMADLARRLRLPVVLVVGMRLGCISHALLTAEAIVRRDLVFAGWVANRIDPAMRRYRDNVEALIERLPGPLLADVPHVRAARARVAAFDRALAADALTRWFSPARARTHES